MICGAKSPDEILQLMEDHGAILNGVHMSLALNLIAKKADQVTSTQRLQDFVEFLEYECLNMNPRSLCTLAWAIAKLHPELDMRNLAAAMASATVQKIDRMDPRQVSSVVWSLAKVRLKHKGLLAAAASRASQTMSDFEMVHLSNLVFGFASLGEENVHMMSKVASRVRDCLRGARTDELAVVAFGLASLGVRDELMMQDLAKEVVRWKPYGKMKCTDWGTFLLSFASLDVQNEELVDACASELSAKELARSTRWTICALSVACSKLKVGKQLARMREEVEKQVQSRGITDADLQADFFDPSTYRPDAYVGQRDVGR